MAMGAWAGGLRGYQVTLSLSWERGSQQCGGWNSGSCMLSLFPLFRGCFHILGPFQALEEDELSSNTCKG